MTSDLAITTVIAVTIVVLWGSIGVRAQTRWQRENDHYWALYPIICPSCGKAYTSQEMSCRQTILGFSPSYNGAAVHCSGCGEIAEFERTEHDPRFIAFCEQMRQCQECGELLNGTIQTICPVCGQADSKLVEK